MGPISGLLLGSENQRAVQTTRELRKALQLPELFGDPSGQACTGDNRDYPNGALPARARCPLVGSPGETLRPGAAAAFNALSKAFERDTGATICVTDSYRSLAEQVSVKADKGKWAATPGRSQHGLGLAVDLCGGIQSFGPRSTCGCARTPRSTGGSTLVGRGGRIPPRALALGVRRLSRSAAKHVGTPQTAGQEHVSIRRGRAGTQARTRRRT